jgi:hypothetical protein
MPTASTSTVPELGRGVVAIGPDRLEFEVRTCTVEPAADDRPSSHRVFLMEGDGTVDDEQFAVQAVRYEASGAEEASLTVTETVRITIGTGEAIEGVEAERSGVGDRWLDVRDAGADRPLLVNDGDVVRAEGTFGPDGSSAGEASVLSGRLVARCPA